jgi:predicted transcriptional regulator
MTNGSDSLYVSRRSDLEILLDVAYLLAEESRPLSATYLTSKEKVGVKIQKLYDILEKCEDKGLAKHFDVGRTRKKYELTQHGKELIYTWLGYVDKFNLKGLLKSWNKDFGSLSEKQNSRLQEIMKTPWKKPNYKKCDKRKKSEERAQIMQYRDFLSYLKKYYPDETYQWDIIQNVNINSKTFKKLKEFALVDERKHIERKYTAGYAARKWKYSIVKKGEFEVFQPKGYDIRVEKRKEKRKKGIKWRGNADELIKLTEDGYRCVNTFDKIMMGFKLTDLVYSYRK